MAMVQRFRVLERLIYFVEKAFASVRAAPGLTILTSGTIAAALVVLGAYVMGLQNLERLTLVWGRSATLSAYLSDQVEPSEWEAVRHQIESFDSVGRAELVTPKQALERFRNRGPHAAALVEGVTEEVLPAQVEVTLQSGFADLNVVEAVAQSMAALPQVEEVDYGREEFDRLQALLDVLRYVGLVAGLLLALATAFIVSNTIRLTVYARRDEISILRLVGATGWFIRTPFLVEGALWGLLGGGLGVGALVLADVLLGPRATEAIADVLGGLDVDLFDAPVGLLLMATGLALGVGGSALAVRRFMGEESV